MISLKAEKREIYGKKLKTARAGGRLPAVVYGEKKASEPLFVDHKDFKKVLVQAGESAVISLETDGGRKDVLIQEVATHPVSDEPIHVDFLAVDRGRAIEVKVSLSFEGSAAAIKELGGTLVKVLHELAIETLPQNIPHEIVVDISPLATLESQILVKDLSLPAGVKVLNPPEAVVALLAARPVEEEVVEAAPADLSAIEVEKRGKKEEDEAA